MRTLVVLLSLAFAGQLAAQSTLSGTIQSGGLTREYLLYVPASYQPGTPAPLVLNLHGYSSNNVEQLLYGDFRPIADTAGFLLVCPNGTLDNQGQRFWNTFLGNSPVDDVAFLSGLIDTLAAEYDIDPNRIYSTGMSNGGFMSYSLACELSDRITAIASVTGSMIQSRLNACDPGRPVPVMEIHGTADNTVPYNGSAINTFVAIPTLVAAWAMKNGCDPTPVTTAVPNTSTTDGCTAERQLFANGDNGSTVEHFKVNGGGHTWPGAIFPIGVTNQDFSASREIWRFFSQYRLDALTTATYTPEMNAGWSVFPNPAQDYALLQPAGDQVAQQIRVFDAFGRLQTTLQPASAGAVRLETAGWAPGVYFVLVEGQTARQSLSLVKTQP